ncbi:AAA family ATPase [Scleromatobacter humisilvae]|uniref:AAA family ATPase n=1 Tax=Scleromatobacter humisilvae TaxID=2897159 RepID=A0A9X1YEF5_9BURK|nr:AAA family ATPase [Scleromatobacter humisilvae]MCK9684371.1 AAA family ATPase [Scleromatobacter humisilvae]
MDRVSCAGWWRRACFSTVVRISVSWLRQEIRRRTREPAGHPRAAPTGSGLTLPGKVLLSRPNSSHAAPWSGGPPETSMYEAHFGLAELPFRIAPDPRFYVDAAPHRAAIRALLDRLGRGEDFTPLIGEFGMGKTTVARRLLEEADPARHVVAELPHVRVEGDELLDRIAEALGMRRAKGAPPMGALIPQFEALARDGRDAWLLVDEADSLSVGALNRLRKLSSVRVDGRAALHVFLVGRSAPAGIAELRRIGRPLNIGAPVRMGSLDAYDTREYILERLRRAGWAGRPLFDARTTAEIHARCLGSPGRINRLCGRMLLHLFMQGRHEIDLQVVCEVDELLHSELNGEPAALEMPPLPPPRPRADTAPPVLSTKVGDLDLDIQVPPAAPIKDVAPARRPAEPRRAVAVRPAPPVRRVPSPQRRGLPRSVAVVALLVCGGVLWHSILRVAGAYSEQSRFAAAAAAFSRQETAAAQTTTTSALQAGPAAGPIAPTPDALAAARRAIDEAPTGAGPAPSAAVAQSGPPDAAPAASVAGTAAHTPRTSPRRKIQTASAIKPAARPREQ